MNVSVTILIVTILVTGEHILGLIERPAIQENDILATESAIRDITNRLFDNLQLRPSETQTTRLRNFTTIHNYLISLTLKDYDNLKEIGKLARVDNGSDKVDQFIGVINEILNENIQDGNNISLSEADVDRDVISTVDTFLSNLHFLKTSYSPDKGVDELNKELSRHVEFQDENGFDYNHGFLSNFTFVEEDSEDDEKNDPVGNTSDFWRKRTLFMISFL